MYVANTCTIVILLINIKFNQHNHVPLTEILFGTSMKRCMHGAFVITRVTENSISTIKFYRVFLKIYER